MSGVIVFEEAGRVKRGVVKYSALDRFLHLVHLVCFVILGLTGIALTFRSAGWAVHIFGSYANVKSVHHMFAWGYVFSAALLFLKVLPHEILASYDFKWLAKLGGYLDPKHKTKVPAGRINAGQKLFYWLVFLGTILLAWTGFVIMYTPRIPGQDIYLALHNLASLIMIAAVIVHFYLATIANPGTIQLMVTGVADEDFIREHNPKWYEELKSKGDL